jgi:hypothetical protein
MKEKRSLILISSLAILTVALFSFASVGFATWNYVGAVADESATGNAAAVSWSFPTATKDVTVVPGSSKDPNYGDCGYYDDKGKLISNPNFTMSFTVDTSTGNATLTTLTNFNNSAYSVVLPSSITDSDGNTYPVTDLEGDGVGNIFRGQSSSTNYAASVHQITLPDTLTTIGADVFKNCVSLSSISFPSSLTTLGVSAFQGSQISSVNLVGTKVTEIPSYCFADCSTCQTVTLLGSLVQKIDDYAFYNCNMGTLSLPSTLQSIGTYGLYGGWWNYSGATYSAAASNFASVTLGAAWTKGTSVTITGSDNKAYSASVTAA